MAVKFSLIVPVYNVEKYLPVCLDSICSQTWQNFEAIIVNDGSTDNSGEICAAYACKDHRFKVVSRPNGGLSAARNTGLKYTSGEFIIFVDSDDWIERDMLDNYAREIVKWPNVANLIIISGYNKIWEKSSNFCISTKVKHSYRPKYEVMNSREATLELLEDYSFCNYMWNKCYSTAIFDGVCFPEGIIYEDIPTQTLLFPRADKLVKLPYIAYNYRINRAGQICADKSIINEASYINSLLIRHGQLDEPDFQNISCNKIFSGFINFLDKTWKAECSEQNKSEVRSSIIAKISDIQPSLELYLSPVKKILLRCALRNTFISLIALIIFNRINHFRWRVKNLIRRCMTI